MQATFLIRDASTFDAFRNFYAGDVRLRGNLTNPLAMWISLNVATACRRREWERHKLEKRRFQLFPSEQSRRLFPSAITSPRIYSSRSPFASFKARGFHRSAASSRISRPPFVARGLPPLARK